MNFRDFKRYLRRETPEIKIGTGAPGLVKSTFFIQEDNDSESLGYYVVQKYIKPPESLEEQEVVGLEQRKGQHEEEG